MTLGNTLTSYGILKINIDHGGDYLDYLKPFILQVLAEKRPDPVRTDLVSEQIRNRFGLEIPSRTIEIVLKRISRSYSLKKENYVYRITGDLPDPGITAKQSAAQRNIDAVIRGLQEFSRDTPRPLLNPDDAVVAICAFLSKFDIVCLRAYLAGTAIPKSKATDHAHIVLVSDYVQFLQQNDPQRFDDFHVLVQGHMLANALLCPDLQFAPRSYRDVTFYFDTPLLVHSLSLEGESRYRASRELIDLIKRLDGTVATFRHSHQELSSVLRGAAEYIHSDVARGAIVREARIRGTTRSELFAISESLEERLNEAKIELHDSPGYVKDLQIDEAGFEDVLRKEVSYHNETALQFDINSVRSIYVLRRNKRAPTVERAGAVLVTSNSAFAKAAWEFGKQHEGFRDVSSVITDFSLANMAWLKVPMGAPFIPKTQLLALSYGALEPTSSMLTKYINEIDRLQENGTITPRDHQLLRSSPKVTSELMHLTLGNDASLTEETVAETLERVSREIKKEESEKLADEQDSHRRTQTTLRDQQDYNQKIVRNLYWRCKRVANIWAWCFSAIACVVVGLGLCTSYGFQSTNEILAAALGVGTALFFALQLLNALFGLNSRILHNWLCRKLELRFLRHYARVYGIEVSEIGNLD